LIAVFLAAPADWVRAVELVGQAGLPVEDLRAEVQHLWVAKDGATVVGVIGVEVYENTGLVRSMTVNVTLRHQGIASTLYQALEGWWNNRGPLVLLTETAEGFFAQRGFATVDRGSIPEPVKASAEFRDLCPLSAKAMIKAAP